MPTTLLALLGFLSWTLLLLVLMEATPLLHRLAMVWLALVLLAARAIQSLIHLASTSPTAVTAPFTAFLVQMGIAITWAFQLYRA